MLVQPSLRPARRRLTFVVAAAVLIGACGGGGAATDTPSDPTVPPTADASSAPPTPDGDPAASPSASSVGASVAPSASVAAAFDQPWATATLTDVTTGEAFTIADLASSGRTVIVETMAIWCSNCFRQQGNVYEALGSLDADRVAYVLLDVDPNETADALADYRERNGFTGMYAIATSDVARGLAAEFGDQVLNPPAVPMLLVAPDGRVTLAEFGGHAPDEVVALAQDHGA